MKSQLWFGVWPALDRLHRLGLKEAAREDLILNAEATLPKAWRMIDIMCALELAAEKYLKEHGHEKPHA